MEVTLVGTRVRLTVVSRYITSTTRWLLNSVRKRERLVQLLDTSMHDTDGLAFIACTKAKSEYNNAGKYLESHT